MMLACIFLHFWQNSEKLYFHGFQNSHCEISFFFSTKLAFNVKAIYTCKDKHVALNRLHYNSAQQQHLTSILIKDGGNNLGFRGKCKFLASRNHYSWKMYRGVTSLKRH